MESRRNPQRGFEALADQHLLDNAHIYVASYCSAQEGLRVKVALEGGVCWRWCVLEVVCVGGDVCWRWCVLEVVCVGGGVCWRWRVLEVVCVGGGVCWR